MLAFAFFRCVTRELIDGFLVSWISGAPGLSDTLIVQPHFLLCHYCDVVLLVEVLLGFAEIDPFLVQQPIEQFEILQTSLDVAVFPQPILSTADEVQHILGFCGFEASSACGA